MKKIIISYFASIGTLMGFMLACTINHAPLMVLTVCMFAGSMIWFTDIVKKIYHRKNRRSTTTRKVREFYSIDIPLDDVDIKKGNVHPGSRPSEMYIKMVGGDDIDSRTENQAAST